MNDENTLPKKLMLVNIPSDLRKGSIDELKEESIEAYLKAWEIHATPLYRMEIDDRDKLILISKLQDIAILDLPHYMYREFKNVLDLYSRGYWLATASTTGAICEYFTKKFIPKEYNIQNLKWSGQKDRIIELSRYLDEEEKELLLKINHTRNACLHLDILKLEDLRKQAIEITNLLLKFIKIISIKYFQKKK